MRAHPVNSQPTSNSNTHELSLAMESHQTVCKKFSYHKEISVATLPEILFTDCYRMSLIESTE